MKKKVVITILMVISISILLIIGINRQKKISIEDFPKYIRDFQESDNIEVEIYKRIEYPEEVNSTVELFETQNYVFNVEDNTYFDVKRTVVGKIFTEDSIEESEWESYLHVGDEISTYNLYEEQWRKTILEGSYADEDFSIVPSLRTIFLNSEFDDVEIIDSTEESTIFRVYEKTEDALLRIDQIRLFRIRNDINYSNFAPYYCDVRINNKSLTIEKIDYTFSSIGYLYRIFVGLYKKTETYEFKEFFEATFIIETINLAPEEFELPEVTKTIRRNLD